MTATDVLRRLLDERGVEWMPSAFDPQHETFYDVNGVGFIVTEFPEIGRMSLACDMRITPEQAIAATLGETPTPPPPTMPEQPPYDLLIDLLRDEWDIDVSWDGLRRFWYVGLTDEGVRKRDEREATLGATDAKPTQAESSETCHITDNGPWGYPYVCSACGASFDPDINGGEFNFCPNCGRRIVDEKEDA